MFFISWRGYGLLVFVFALLSLLIAYLVEGRDALNHITMTLVVCFVLSSVALWIIGYKLNGDLDAYEAPHIFMGVKLQYCGAFYLVPVFLLKFIV